jgi:hypothetical protein
MVKKIFAGLVCFVGVIVFISTLHGQGSKKTITLPNGDVVCDLNGEWDALYESGAGKFPDIVRITQEGGSFVGVKVIGTPAVPKGQISIKGELDKNGVKEAVVNGGRLQMRFAGAAQQKDPDSLFLYCKGEISEDGNKIILEGSVVTVTLTRR